MSGAVDPAMTVAADDIGAEPTVSSIHPPPPAAPDAAEPVIGSQVGPWLLRRLLGHGGMGDVYLAERNEQDFQQRAALKLIKLGMDSGEIQRRFLSERRILARLEHPNIARLIDGGVDSRGRPYFVMEWVDGLPLTDYANAHRLDADSRLRVFLKLCDAVAHAHRQLVVHRDLKPGNILVDTRGEPKLLDFGIAKVLESDNTQDTSATGARFFTRAYAAPEQLRGEPVTTATDIYALGAVLFELLTGTPLQRARSSISPTRELLALARRQAGSEGPPAVTPRMLAGDLALVLAMAVRDEPTRRYASVEAFAEDLRACLAGRPVRARADTAGYRIVRFVRRHWIGVGASVAVLTAIVGGAGVAMWQARIARAEALRAEAVSNFLSSVFESATTEGGAGSDITARSLLETGSQRIERELAGQPAVRARLDAIMAKAWFYIGNSGRAVELYEAGRAAVSAEDWRTQAELLRGLAEAELSLGQINEARIHVDQAMALLDGRGANADLDRVLTLKVSKSVLGVMGDKLGAREMARTVHADLSRILGARAERTLEALNDLGLWTLETGDAAAALPIFDEVIEQRRQVSGPDHPELATAMHNRVQALTALNRNEEALKQAREVVALRRRILPPLHRDLARSLGAHATIEARLGDISAARSLRGEAIDLLRAQRRPDTLLLAGELTNQAVDAFRDGDLSAAASDLNEALANLQPMLQPGDPRVLAASLYLGLVESYLGQTERAEQRLREVSRLELAQTDYPLGQKLATARYRARVLRWQGRIPEAQAVLGEAESWIKSPAAALSTLARSRFQVELALTALAAGQLDASRENLELAQRALTEAPGNALDQAQLLIAHARLALARQDPAGAAGHAQSALELLRAQLKETHWDIGEARGLLAVAQWQIHHGRKERAALMDALQWHEAQRPWHPDTARLRELTGR